MIRIENFFKTLFMMVSLSEANFVKFVEDHLERLRINNPGSRYAALIAALTAIFNEFKTAIDQRNLNQALQESQTLTVDQIIAAFKAKMSRIHTDITDRWDIGTPIYEKFFPHGLEEYSKATKGNIGSLMNRFISVCDIHRADLPEGFVIPFTELKAQWEADRPAQLSLIGNTDGNRLTVAEKREAVAVQVTKNVHTIALDFIGNTNAASVYFDQSIISKPVKQNGEPSEPEVYAEVVAPVSSVVILHGGFDANTMFHFVNTGSVNLKFYTANMPEDVVPTNALELAPGEEDEILASDLGAGTNLFLMVHNGNTTITGSYEVSISEE